MNHGASLHWVMQRENTLRASKTKAPPSPLDITCLSLTDLLPRQFAPYLFARTSPKWELFLSSHHQILKAILAAIEPLPKRTGVRIVDTLWIHSFAELTQNCSRHLVRS